MTVFGYVRVSTPEQAQHGKSLDTQRNQIIGYCMMKGWQAGEVFIEAGVSGSIPFADRPEGKRLMTALKADDAIVTPKLDRMFRSARDALETLEGMKAGGVSLHMIDLGGDVTGNGISKLVFTILSAVAENERERTRERIRDVKRHLRSQGRYAGGKRPFGYDVVGDRLVPNEAEQAQIADMRSRRVNGETFRVIGAAYGKEATSIRRIINAAPLG